MQQATDFGEEVSAFASLLEPLPDEAWDLQTQFKGWTINDVVAHLCLFDYAADLTLRDEEGYLSLVADLRSVLQAGTSLVDYTRQRLGGISGRALLSRWHDGARALATQYAAADPQQRVRWGPQHMSTRSCISGRQMETWSHGQAVYDVLGQDRVDTDRIQNIARIGVNTFEWTFRNRKLPTPAMPFVGLTSPSGAVWEWGDPASPERVVGCATEFCQVVSQTRNVADTALSVSGNGARQWMAIAQCFSGPPQDPPKPGSRYCQQFP